MLVPNLIIFYAKDPLLSAAFYEKLFELKPVTSFPTFVSFKFPNDFYFSLWSTQAKDFVSEGEGERSELSFMVKDEEEVKELYEKWQEFGVEIEQELRKAVFGLTFVALDPDGHRIRVCIPDK